MKYTEIEVDGDILRGFYDEAEDSNGLVVFFHGFTGHKNENGFFFKQLSEWLVKKGYSTLRMDFRGSGDSDLSFEKMTFFTELADAKAILDYALTLEPQKLYVLGFSLGGAIASRVSLDYQDKIDKLILIAPVGSNQHVKRFTSWYDNRRIDLGGFLLGKEYITTLANYNFFEGIDKFVKPVLIIHGMDDQTISIASVIGYAMKYPNADYVAISGADHCFTKVRYRHQVFNYIYKFLEDEKKKKRESN